MTSWPSSSPTSTTARARLLALGDTHRFKQMPHFVAVESPLHSTNDFQCDANCLRAFDL